MIKYAKIINEETKQCEVGVGTNKKFYQSIGMTEMEVEEAYNGQWFLKGYAPLKPEPTDEEQKQARILELKKFLLDTDYISCKLIEAIDEAELQDLKEKYKDVLKQRREARAEINELEK